MAGEPLLSGDDVVCRLFINQMKIGDDLVVKATIKPNTTKYRDDHMGNRFSRTDMRVWGWDITAQYHYSTDVFIQAIGAYYAALKNPGTAVPVLGMFFGIQERAGAAQLKGYMFTGVVGDWSMDMPGMKERLMQSFDAYAEKMANALITV